MNKLKNKVFVTILSILTISILSFIIVFNIQSYNMEKNNIFNTLNRMSSVNIKPFNDKMNFDNKLLNEDFKFMDTTLYQVILDDENNIVDIINHTPNSVTESDIKKIANNLLKNIKEGTNINNLYLEEYSYYYKDNKLIIIDNTNIKSKLNSDLLFSSIVFIISELLIIILSKLITYWITKPAEEAFKKQKEFIEDASHELKTPLSVIISSSELLTDNPKEIKWLDNIKRESNRMNKLIIDLLELSTLENEKRKVLETGNLSKTVELSCLTFEGKIFENNLKLKYDIQENIEMNMDENNIKQLVEILLDNAIKHSKEKGKIELSLEKTNNDIILIVANEGLGIPKGEEEKIFERFYRVDKSRNRNENRYGLGLSIAKNIVLKHNGKISAYSKNDKTTFKVVFTKK